MAGVVSIDRFKSLLGRPSLTSQYYLELSLPQTEGSDAGFKSALSKKGIELSSGDQENLNLYCTEASLPGSSIATLEQTSDRTGVTERHAHRRVFDDRIDFTFYVDAEKYLVINFFEAWIDYITGDSSPTAGQDADTYFYRMNYSDEYTCSGMRITKFERDSATRGSRLTYNFVRAFPISINSMPVSYDSSQLLKCTVSMTYIRYTIIPTRAATPPAKDTPQPQIPTDFFDPNANFSFSTQQIKSNLNENLFRPGHTGFTDFNTNLGIDLSI
tara:strand:- start:2053 stop:2868 length:816 start_codon:yes stop_codon:yes gene_type:complete